MRKRNLLLAPLPLLLLLLGAGCSLDSAANDRATSDSPPAHFAGDGIEAPADQRM